MFCLIIKFKNTQAQLARHYIGFEATAILCYEEQASRAMHLYRDTTISLIQSWCKVLLEAGSKAQTTVCLSKLILSGPKHSRRNAASEKAFRERNTNPIIVSATDKATRFVHHRLDIAALPLSLILCICTCHACLSEHSAHCSHFCLSCQPKPFLLHQLFVIYIELWKLAFESERLTSRLHLNFSM